VLRTYTPREHGGSFGWYVARVDDLDADGRADLAVGGPVSTDAGGTMVGGAWVFSSATGKELHHWQGTDRRGGFGNIVAAVADLDGDGKARSRSARRERRTGRGRSRELRIYSGATGAELRHWSGRQPGELYGRMILPAGDLDGDGVEDLAIGAPWHRRDTADKVGRVELRSARTGEVITELFGDEADCWFGWHMTRAPDPDGRGRPALLIGSLRHPVDGKVAAGVIDLYVLRRQGTTTRDTRRSDIR
jgi:hypothetical protein